MNQYNPVTVPELGTPITAITGLINQFTAHFLSVTKYQTMLKVQLAPPFSKKTITLNQFCQ